MIISQILIGLGLISRTKFNEMTSKLGYNCTERKRLVYEAKGFAIMVCFKLAATKCISEKIEQPSKIKKVFKQYDCEEYYRMFLKCNKEYPRLLKKLKTKTVLPQSSEEVKEDFARLYEKYSAYIGKYINKKLAILKNRYTNFEDIKSAILENIYIAYMHVFLNPNRQYVENYVKLAIRNAGKLELQVKSRKKRGEINNSVEKSETKVQTVSITEELESVLASPEKKDTLIELHNYVKNGTSIGSRILRILSGNPEERYLIWLKKRKISKTEANKHPVYYARKYFNVDDATWQGFLNQVRQNFI